MMYPKTPRKKKRKKHKESILHQKDGTCYLCMMLNRNYRIHPVVHEHHIYGGANRQVSEAQGLKVYLCPEHHVFGPEAVHNNEKYMEMLHVEGQKVFETTNSRERFEELFNWNYLDRDDERQESTQKEEIEPGFRFLEEDELL